MPEPDLVLPAPGTQWQVGQRAVTNETILIPVTTPASLSIAVQSINANTQAVYIKKAGGSNLWELLPGHEFYIDLDHQKDPLYVEAASGSQTVTWMVLIA